MTKHPKTNDRAPRTGATVLAFPESAMKRRNVLALFAQHEPPHSGGSASAQAHSVDDAARGATTDPIASQATDRDPPRPQRPEEAPTEPLATLTPCDVLTVEEVATLLKIGRNAVYEAVARNQLPHRRIGKQIRFSRDAIMRWFDSWSLRGAKEGK
jgi:excisionase family DNA binding protein